MRDAGWVKQILMGDKAAGRKFITENYTCIYRLLRYLTGSPETAQDLTQQTFSRAWQALPIYRGEAALATWLHRIAYHEYTHWLRSRREHASLDAAAEMPDLRSMPNLESIDLPRALAQLSEDQRATFCLYYLQELSVPEVAVVLEIPEGTVKSRLSSARRRLRELLQDYSLPDTEPQAICPAPE